tara:strand:+ start:698 stop:1054 length:357 start_codon:yes stop_codon:yes gene_type:complete
MDYYWELTEVTNKTIDYAFEGKFRLDMYEYLKSCKFTKGDIQTFLESDTAKSITLLIYDLEDYLEGGSDSMHQQLREAYGHLGKPEARKIKNYLEKILQDCWRYEKEKRTRKRRKPSK